MFSRSCCRSWRWTSSSDGSTTGGTGVPGRWLGLRTGRCGAPQGGRVCPGLRHRCHEPCPRPAQPASAGRARRRRVPRWGCAPCGLGLPAVQQWVSPRNDGQRAVVARILEVTAPTDSVLVEHPWHPIVRYDAGFVWFNIEPFLEALAQMESRGQSVTPYGERMREVISQMPVVIHGGPDRFRWNAPLAAMIERLYLPDPTVPSLWVLRTDQPTPRTIPSFHSNQTMGLAPVTAVAP